MRERGWSLGTYIRHRRGEGWGTAEVDGAGRSAMVVKKDVVEPSSMLVQVESGSVGPSPMVTEVGRYAQT